MRYLFYLLLLFSTLNTYAQQKPKAIKASTGLNSAGGYDIGIGFEQLIGKKSSIAAIVDFLPHPNVSMKRLELAYRFRFHKRDYSLKGFYLGPSIHIRTPFSKATHGDPVSNLKLASTITQKPSSIQTGYGIQAGYEWVIKKHFGIEIYSGISSYSSVYDPWVSVQGRGGISFGYVF
ncbi:DUF3575 domain-containing protein [Algivirga pacifica]|uniref:Outer membrane protein beta-barrel domain-containing protein n=1 Tax=Algivirga pacifica TaxID=1162670 RepID=A0ABP9DJR6_9BACT